MSESVPFLEVDGTNTTDRWLVPSHHFYRIIIKDKINKSHAIASISTANQSPSHIIVHQPNKILDQSSFQRIALVQTLLESHIPNAARVPIETPNHYHNHPLFDLPPRHPKFV